MAGSARICECRGVIPRRIVTSRTEGVKRVGLRISQDVDVKAKLPTVASFGPGDIIHKVVHRNLIFAVVGYCQAGIVWSVIVVQSAKENDVRGMVSDLTKTFPGVAITEIVD